MSKNSKKIIEIQLNKPIKNIQLTTNPIRVTTKNRN